MSKYMVIMNDGEVRFFDQLYMARVCMADAFFNENRSSYLYVLDKEKHYVCKEEL